MAHWELIHLSKTGEPQSERKNFLPRVTSIAIMKYPWNIYEIWTCSMNFSETSHEIIIFPLWNQHFFHGETPRRRGKDIARPVEHQLGIGQSCRFTGANSWFHGIPGRFLRQFYCKKHTGRTIFLGKRHGWTMLNYQNQHIYIYISAKSAWKTRIIVASFFSLLWIHFLWKWLGDFPRGSWEYDPSRVFVWESPVYPGDPGDEKSAKIQVLLYWR